MLGRWSTLKRTMPRKDNFAQPPTTGLKAHRTFSWDQNAFRSAGTLLICACHRTTVDRLPQSWSARFSGIEFWHDAIPGSFDQNFGFYKSLWWLKTPKLKTKKVLNQAQGIFFGLSFHLLYIADITCGDQPFPLFSCWNRFHGLWSSYGIPGASLTAPAAAEEAPRRSAAAEEPRTPAAEEEPRTPAAKEAVLEPAAEEALQRSAANAGSKSSFSINASATAETTADTSDGFEDWVGLAALLEWACFLPLLSLPGPAPEVLCSKPDLGLVELDEVLKPDCLEGFKDIASSSSSSNVFEVEFTEDINGAWISLFGSAGEDNHTCNLRIQHWPAWTASLPA